MAVKITDKQTEAGKEFEKMLDDFKRLEVRVGIQQGKKARKRKKGKMAKTNVDLVDVAMFNELGTAHMPSRPFLRNSVDAHKTEINDFLQSMAKMVSRGTSAEKVLKKIGVFQKGLIQEEIVSGNFEKNKDSTIRRKKSDTPLIDTGRMRQSINYVIREKGESD